MACTTLLGPVYDYDSGSTFHALSPDGSVLYERGSSGVFRRLSVPSLTVLGTYGTLSAQFGTFTVDDNGDVWWWEFSGADVLLLKRGGPTTSAGAATVATLGGFYPGDAMTLAWSPYDGNLYAALIADGAGPTPDSELWRITPAGAITVLDTLPTISHINLTQAIPIGNGVWAITANDDLYRWDIDGATMATNHGLLDFPSGVTVPLPSKDNRALVTLAGGGLPGKRIHPDLTQVGTYPCIGGHLVNHAAQSADREVTIFRQVDDYYLMTPPETWHVGFVGSRTT